MDLFYGLALSLHLGLDGTYNAIHPNIGLTSNNFSLGAYYNSEREISKYISYEYEFNENNKIEFGFVDGYNAYDVLPFVRYKHKNWFISPALEKYNGNKKVGVLIGLEFKK